MLVVLIYMACHVPAFIMLGFGIALRTTNPNRSKILLILAGIYFVIGAGICGSMLS